MRWNDVPGRGEENCAGYDGKTVWESDSVSVRKRLERCRLQWYDFMVRSADLSLMFLGF